ncbi:hypothetical protein MicloDRAFT_00070200 [Microvirga lotononidis]|uniref:Uncharacterized protein n=1 Tax=Microvirga lotononidis TaxID=864069 RepID=I4YK75_9HYPH|nr:hypothetical protein MicloDRAFT_00070200 [Microvirga lotononidis]
MLDARHDLSFCGTIAREFVSDHHARCDALLLEQLAQQPLGCFCIAAALDQNIEHNPILVDRSPEPVLSACDADHHLVEVPLVTRCRKTAVDLIGKTLAELQRPLPHRLMADQDAAGSQHLLDHPRAKGKSKIQPDGVADYFRRKTVAGVARGTCRGHTSSMPAYHHSEVNLTVPFFLDHYLSICPKSFF